MGIGLFAFLFSVSVLAFADSSSEIPEPQVKPRGNGEIKLNGELLKCNAKLKKNGSLLSHEFGMHVSGDGRDFVVVKNLIPGDSSRGEVKYKPTGGYWVYHSDGGVVHYPGYEIKQSSLHYEPIPLALYHKQGKKNAKAVEQDRRKVSRVEHRRPNPDYNAPLINAMIANYSWHEGNIASSLRSWIDCVDSKAQVGKPKSAAAKECKSKEKRFRKAHETAQAVRKSCPFRESDFREAKEFNNYVIKHDPKKLIALKFKEYSPEDLFKNKATYKTTVIKSKKPD